MEAGRDELRIQRVAGLDDPRVAVFRNVRDARLRDAHDLFLAEGRFVVRRLVSLAPQRIHSLFLTPAALGSLRPALELRRVRAPIYVSSREVLSAVVGYRMHQGCLAAGRRGEPAGAAELVGRATREGRPLLALEDLANPDNVGSLWRSASAFGAAGILVSSACADPLSRKAVRVSMGETLRLPFARLEDWGGGLEALRRAGFALVALTPREPALPIEELGRSVPVPERVALLVGSEGRGLRPETLAAADLRLRVAIRPEVDSLNVATAAAIALHRLAGALAIV